MLSRIAPAKLNLYLHLTGRRDDGYHLLDSVVVFTEFGDEVTVESSSSLTLQIDGPFADGLNENDNLVLRAAQLMKVTFAVQQGASIHLRKMIPIGAGLGGGSSDAAAVLILLNQLWNIDASIQELEAIAITLGADVPACLHAKPLHMSGIGEVISPMPSIKLEGYIVLVKPPESLLTAEVYRESARLQTYSTSIEPAKRTAFQQHRNDMQQAAIALCPSVEQVLKALTDQPNCILARLCGSGSSCFGLFNQQSHAQHASEAIAAAYPDWWVTLTIAN